MPPGARVYGYDGCLPVHGCMDTTDAARCTVRESERRSGKANGSSGKRMAVQERVLSPPMSRTASQTHPADAKSLSASLSA